MNDKKYKQQTPILGIPVLGNRDRILPEVELKRWKIIENLLLAGMQGVRAAVFDDGRFRIKSQMEDTFEVTLSGVGQKPSVTGVVSGFFFRAKPVVKWEGLKQGKKYWLYLTTKRNICDDVSSVRAIASERIINKDANLLLATVDLSQEKAHVDPYPQGKVYMKELGEHSARNTNPHGEVLSQETANIKNLNINNLSIDGRQVFLKNLTDSKQMMVDIVTTKAGGVIARFGQKVSYVLTQTAVKDEVRWSGEIAIGYYGQDKTVEFPNEVKIYSQKAGVLLKLIAFYE